MMVALPTALYILFLVSIRGADFEIVKRTVLQIDPQLFQAIDFEQAKQKRLKKIQADQEFDQFLNRKKIR